MAIQAWVSILARPEGRALHLPAVPLSEVNLVSILARPEGRALLGRRANTLEIQNVSILARPEGRALQRQALASRQEIRFQSSPAPKDGRYNDAGELSLAWLLVSILARPEGRALRSNARCSSADMASFNPRPPRRTGATAQVDARLRALAQVSILARPEGRALPGTNAG